MKEKKMFRLKIYLWYLCTEPLRQAKELLKHFLEMLAALNKTMTWIYIFLIFSILFMVKGDKPYTGLFLIALVFIILAYEYQRGFFMYRYRQKIKEGIKEKLKKEGGK